MERSVPVVTLPLGATRDRVTGTLSVAEALDGGHAFDPGLLARANRGVLYVDEVNLLDDHLVDLLLDAAASGLNRVERDGVSVTHPAEFTLVGTMNPEEGDLRPQLRDRFALQTSVTGCHEVEDRVEVVERALGTHGGGDGDDEDHAARLRHARDLLADVQLSDVLAREIAELCRDAGVEGHRADIATARTARAFAALDGRPTVLESDVRDAAALALAHRMRSKPFEEAPDPEELMDERFEDGEEREGAEGSEGEPSEAESESDSGAEGGAAPESSGEGNEERDASDGADSEGNDSRGKGGDRENDGAKPSGDGAADERGDTAHDDAERSADEPTGEGEHARAERADESDENPDDATPASPLVPGARPDSAEPAEASERAAPDLPAPSATGGTTGSGRSRTAERTGDGARMRTERADPTDRVDVPASVRAAAARGGTAVESRDLRRSVRRTDATALVLFVVDASASMRPAMRAAKGTVLELLQGSYEARDEVGFVAFAGDDAEVLLPPTDSVTLAARHLKELPTGDRTPLPAGLRTAATVLDRADPAASVVVLVTDGRANVAEGSPVRETREAARALGERRPEVVVVDAGDGDASADRAGLIGQITEGTGGRRVPLSALSAERIDEAVRGE
jgi:magnesium chelatase subunit D